MTTEDALTFLQKHQPLPPTKGISNALLTEFDEVRKHFIENPDERCVPLLLNAFGDGDGHGIYQLVEDTIICFSKNVVISELKTALRNRSGSVRYWNAQIAANYPTAELAAPLLDLLREGNVDERMAAVTALEGILSPDVRINLQSILSENIEAEVKELIREVLGNRVCSAI